MAKTNVIEELDVRVAAQKLSQEADRAFQAGDRERCIRIIADLYEMMDRKTVVQHVQKPICQMERVTSG